MSVSAGPEYPYPVAGATYDDEYVVGPVLRACERLGVKRVLDIGCGNGALCARLVARGYAVTGLDPSESGVALARQQVPDATFHHATVHDAIQAIVPGSADLVCAVEVVEHLTLPRELPRLARHALTPGGHLIITTPYHGYLKNLVLSLTHGWDRHLDPLWDGGHVKFWSVPTLRRLLTEEGFAVTSVQGAGRWPWLWKSVVVTARRR